MNKTNEHISDWLLRFILVSICIFSFSALDSRQNEKKSFHEQVKIIHQVSISGQSAIQSIPLRIPDYSGDIEITNSSDFSKYTNASPYILTHTSETNIIYFSCLKSYNHNKRTFQISSFLRSVYPFHDTEPSIA